MPSLQPSVVFVVAVIVLSVVEYRWRVRTGRGYDLGALGGTVGTAIGQFLFKGLMNGVIGVAMLGVFALAPIQWPLDDWRTWIAGFVVLEFFYYWQHRFSHTIRWFWASHAMHHSASELTLPAAARLSWTGAISGLWVFFLPMTLLGFHPLLVATLLTLNLQYQYFIHTEAVGRLGPLEWILNTPAHHRVHHASNAEYLDKNFGGVLIVFDRMFGTFQTETATPIVYGLPRPLRSNNPFVIALHEWGNLIGDVRAAGSIKGVWRALFGRPGAASPHRHRSIDASPLSRRSTKRAQARSNRPPPSPDARAPARTRQSVRAHSPCHSQQPTRLIGVGDDVTRKIFPLLAVLTLAACASQPEPSGPRSASLGPTRTLQDLNGSRVAMPVGLFLTSLDTDRDTRIDLAEVRDGAAATFDASDANVDGYLRPIEFEAWSRTYLGAEYTSPGRLQFDHDQDGRVSRDEFAATFDQIRTRLDGDRDGVLTRGELLVEINGAGMDPGALRAQIEAEMRRNIQGMAREMCRRGGRGA